MNFQELIEKLKAMDESKCPECGMDPCNCDHEKVDEDDEVVANKPKAGEKELEECGGMMGMGMPPAPKQQDSVSMNINMSGSGTGGIRDLISILKNIDGGDNGAGEIEIHKHPIIDGPGIDIDEFANEPDEMYADAGAVTGTGNDMHSNNGDHRMRQTGLPVARPQMESLVQKLTEHYNQVKAR